MDWWISRLVDWWIGGLVDWWIGGLVDSFTDKCVGWMIWIFSLGVVEMSYVLFYGDSLILCWMGHVVG